MADVSGHVMFRPGRPVQAVADAQMFAFQTEKYRRKGAGEEMGPYASGFIQTGLWAWSRHPNYFCEAPRAALALANSLAH